jgi:uncharacterized membrane protein
MTYEGPVSRAAEAHNDREGELVPVHPSRASIMGHPLHPILVPLPIASLVGAFVSDVAYLRTGDRFWARASKTLLATGLLTGLAAAPLGMLDFASLPHARKPIDGWIHGIGNAAVLGLAAANLAGRRGDGERAIAGSDVLLSATTAALLGVSGWFGGELVFRHRIGVGDEDADQDPVG